MPRVHRVLAVLLLLLVLSFGVAQDASADAQTEQPKLQVVIIDSDPRDDGKAYEPISRALEVRSDVRVRSEKDFLESAKTQRVTLETLRKGSEREEAEERIAGAMEDAGVEVLIVVDAITKRRVAQAVVLGPKGRELGDIREPIAKLDSNTDVDRLILDEAFAVAAPDVAQHRQKLARRAQEAERAERARLEAEQQAAVSTDGTGEVTAQSEVEGAASEKGPGVVLQVGLLVGQRNFEADAADSPYAVSSSTPLLGGTARLGLRIVEFSSGEVRIDGRASYAPLSVQFVADGGDPFTVTGHHVTGRAELGYRHWFGNVFSGLKLGSDAVSSTLDPNSYFTGSRYISGLAGLEFGLLTAGGVGVSVEGGILPVLDSNVSGDAYGPADTIDIAYFGDAAIGYAVTGSIALEVGYGVRAYSSRYDEPTIAMSPVSSSDFIHGGNLSVALGF